MFTTHARIEFWGKKAQDYSTIHHKLDDEYNHEIFHCFASSVQYFYIRHCKEVVTKQIKCVLCNLIL